MPPRNTEKLFFVRWISTTLPAMLCRKFHCPWNEYLNWFCSNCLSPIWFNWILLASELQCTLLHRWDDTTLWRNLFLSSWFKGEANVCESNNTSFHCDVDKTMCCRCFCYCFRSYESFLNWKINLRIFRCCCCLRCKPQFAGQWRGRGFVIFFWFGKSFNNALHNEHSSSGDNNVLLWKSKNIRGTEISHNCTHGNMLTWVNRQQMAN